MGVLYQVYWLSFTTLLGTAREYVGMTKVKSGQAPKAALSERRRWHLAKPVAWLKCAVAASVRLYPIGAPCGYEDALADEALEAAAGVGPPASPENEASLAAKARLARRRKMDIRFIEVRRGWTRSITR